MSLTLKEKQANCPFNRIVMTKPAVFSGFFSLARMQENTLIGNSEKRFGEKNA